MRVLKAIIFLCFLTGIGSNSLAQDDLSLNCWTYIEVDSSRAKWGDFNEPGWLRYFGLDMEDLNLDGFKDIISGRNIYLNPGGNMAGTWERVDLGLNVDAMLVVDIDDDQYPDIIAEALPSVYWLEANDLKGHSWHAMQIGYIPATGHVNGQGYLLADIIAGGKQEILLSAHDGIYACEIPEIPVPDNFVFRKIITTSSDEGFAAGDLDGDGDLDIVAGDYPKKEGEEKEPNVLKWWVNPNTLNNEWAANPVGQTNHAIDRVEIADINGDGELDIVIAEERYPGKEPDASLYWFERREGNFWNRHIIVTQYSMNNLDVADVDQDGDMDIVTNEHKGSENKTQIFANNGKGYFEAITIDQGKECHLGTKFCDLDGDGDLDLVGHAWDNYQYMHVWRNDALSDVVQWKHLSTADGSLPPTGLGSQQTSSLVADLDKDGINDIVITDRSVTPSLVWYRYKAGKWQTWVIDDSPNRVEAGSAFADIDGDGDLDILFAGDGGSNEIWWWENPYPNYKEGKNWKKFYVKNGGENKHHDQMFVDFDGDGKEELVFWNQNGTTLFYAEIPDNPKKLDSWDYKPIYTYSDDSEMQQNGYQGYPGWKGTNEHEGLDKADIDGDGIQDIVGGGLWFKYTKQGFITNIVDESYTFTRSAAGQFIEGGRPEVVLVAGDGLAPMYIYEWREGTWYKQMLIEEVDNGHTLNIVDFNKDGHMDIFSAEMRFGEGNPDSKIRILLGDGKGNFVHHVVAEGFGVHEGRIVDLDGDGDLDILAKPYSWQAPRLDIFINEGV